MGINGRFFAALKIIYCDFVSVRADGDSWWVYRSSIDTPRWIITDCLIDIVVFEWIPLNVLQIKHSHLTGHVNRHYEFLPVALYQLEIVDFWLKWFDRYEIYIIICKRDLLKFFSVTECQCDWIKAIHIQFMIHGNNNETMFFTDYHQVHFLNSLVVQK